MKNQLIFLIICLATVISYFLTCRADEDDEEIFTDYCNPELCKYTKNASHTGCMDGKPHDGKFQVPPCKPDANRILNLTDEMKAEIIEIHNYQRNYVACGGLKKSVNLNPACRMGVVQWDDELEATAYLHVTYCTNEHDKCRNTLKYPFTGQNLGLLCGEMLRNLSAYTTIYMHLWYMEYKLTWPEIVYSYVSKPDNPMIGHFLTMNNQYNNRVGCVLGNIFEVTTKEQCTVLTCNYAMTNIKGFPTYTPCKVPAAECTTGTDSKYKYLCSENEEYRWNKPVRAKKYDVDDTETYDDCGPAPEDVYKIGKISDGDANMPPIESTDPPTEPPPVDPAPEIVTDGMPNDDDEIDSDDIPDDDNDDELVTVGTPPAAVRPKECKPTKKRHPTKVWPAPR
ncbi:hypothetical protein DOY81_010767 [Sarcophaga bullata]|nr:hypothetical protein DOY81_010767 [Sarcophaga bullata]